MTLTRSFDRTGKPRWVDESGRPVRSGDPLRCGCKVGLQVCMRCYRCRQHCWCCYAKPAVPSGSVFD